MYFVRVGALIFKATKFPYSVMVRNVPVTLRRRSALYRIRCSYSMSEKNDTKNELGSLIQESTKIEI